MESAVVGLIMGSESDWAVVEDAATVLDKFQVSWDATVASAHRTPERAVAWAGMAEKRGMRVIIAAAGLAAHLPGVVAAHTTLPVIGLPVGAGPLTGVDALYSIVQMPPGVPVATVGINAGRNAGLLAVQIAAVGDPVLQEKLFEYKQELAAATVAADKRLQETLAVERAARWAAVTQGQAYELDAQKSAEAGADGGIDPGGGEGGDPAGPVGAEIPDPDPVQGAPADTASSPDPTAAALTGPLGDDHD